MNSNRPLEISLAEWKEIVQVPEVREGWGLTDDETPEVFAEMVYGVKFAFQSGGPGYVGDLYILQGETLQPPLLLIKSKTGVLSVVKD